MASRFNACIGGMLLLFSTGLAAETLVYEREFTLIAESDNLLRIELDSSDRLRVYRPVSMTHPGLHELQAPAGTYERMRRAFEEAHTDTNALYADVQQAARSGDTEWIVTDPEFSRFGLLRADRTVQEEVTAVSLEAWSMRIDDERLQRLAALEKDWYALMNSEIQGASK